MPAALEEPSTWSDARRLASQETTWIARGAGRSYGDASLPQKDGGRVILGTRLDRMLAFDPRTGDLTAEAGVTLHDIIAVFQPRGWFLPTTPGTKFVTLGGAVAADVHGKNHHVDGSFSAHVQAITLLTADGRELQLTRQDHSRYFWATVGGMGLTGLILAVQLRLRRIPSAWYRVRYERAPDIDAAIARLAEEDNGHRYSVAWIDCLASGKSLGRSVLMLGNDAEPEELPTAWRRRPMAIPRKRRLLVPFDFPNGALTGLSVSAFNQVFYWKHAVGTHIVDYDSYFYPLDSVRHWNRIYGRRGFVQFQALFPEQTAAGGLRRVLEALSTARLASFLAVLKRSGAAGSGLLSYLFPGYTLALDIPNAGEDLRRLHDRLQRILLELGGRIYFAKDTLGTSEAIAAMYPRLEEFRAVQAELDPAGRIRSRLSSRLSLLKDR